MPGSLQPQRHAPPSHHGVEHALRRPVFLVGSERSGTTILRVMLNRHPGICFHHEFELAVDHIADDGSFPDVQQYLERMRLDRIFQHSRFTVEPGLSYPELMDSFLRQKLDASGKAFIGAKVHRHFDKLLHLWPEARFIHLIRDGRDVARSIVGMGWAGNAWAGADEWIKTERAWDVLCPKLEPERWIEVRYQDLIARPEQELEALCAFFDVAYDPCMLEPEPDCTYGRPDPSRIEQWREASRREVQLIESKIAPMLLSRGFELSGYPPLAPSLLSRIWLALDSRGRKAAFRIRRYGTRLWLLWLLTSRLKLARLREKVQQKMNDIDEQHLR